MDGTPTEGTRVGAAGGAAVAIVAALLLGAPPAVAAPRVLSVKFDPPPVVGRKTNLTVRATDPNAPITGLVVRFGAREGSFGSSACRVPGVDGGRTPAAFAPGAAVRLTAPHIFTTTGPRPVLTTVASGGCGSVAGTVLQPTLVTPTRPREAPVPIVPGPQVPLPVPDPVLGPAARAPSLSRQMRRCRGARRRIGRTTGALRRAARRFLCLHNRVRRAYRLPRLRRNRRLWRAARRHSRAMVRLGFFAHIQPGGLDLLGRIREAGYARLRGLASARTYALGENLAFRHGNHTSPLAVMRAWMASSGHRANVLERGFRDVGVGLVRGTPGHPRAPGVTVTVDFGVRR